MLLPYRAFELASPFAPADALQAIAAAVEPRRIFRLRAGSRPFEGTVTGASFEIQRIISYRNSFLPQIHGTIVPSALGSRVSLKMRLHVVVLIFIFVWSSGVFSIGTGIVVGAVRGQLGSPFAAIPFGMLFFLWALTTGAFWFEARKAEQLLCQLLNAHRAESLPW